MHPESSRDALESALLAVDRLAARRALSAVQGDGAAERVERLIVPVLERIGRGWEQGRVSLSQVYMAGRLCEELVDEFLPSTHCDRRGHPPMAIVALEDFHLLGLRVVYSVVRAAGFELHNYGRLTVSELLQRVERDGIAILLISVLMLPSALRIKDVVAGLRAAGRSTRLIAGGAPFRFDAALGDEVGVDAVGMTATDAVAQMRRWLQEAPWQAR